MTANFSKCELGKRLTCNLGKPRKTRFVSEAAVLTGILRGLSLHLDGATAAGEGRQAAQVGCGQSPRPAPRGTGPQSANTLT